MKLYIVKLKSGDLFYINEPTHKALRRVLSQNFKERSEFFHIDENETIKVDYIAYIKLDKE